MTAKCMVRAYRPNQVPTGYLHVRSWYLRARSGYLKDQTKMQCPCCPNIFFAPKTWDPVGKSTVTCTLSQGGCGKMFRVSDSAKSRAKAISFNKFTAHMHASNNNIIEFEVKYQWYIILLSNGWLIRSALYARFVHQRRHRLAGAAWYFFKH